MSSAPLPRIVPVLLGSSQSDWQDLLSRTGLSSLYDAPLSACDLLSPDRDRLLGELASADVAVLLIGRERLASFTFLVDPDIGKSGSSIAVVPSASDLSAYGPRLALFSEFVSADNPTFLMARLEVITNEVRQGKRPRPGTLHEAWMPYVDTLNLESPSSSPTPDSGRQASANTGNSEQEESLDGPDEDGGYALVSFETISERDFSPFAWDVIMTSRKIGEDRPRPAASMRRLAVAFLIAGQTPESGQHAGNWLWEHVGSSRDSVRRRIEKMYPAVREFQWSLERATRPRGAPVELMTPSYAELIEVARQLAKASQPPGRERRICLRHLVAASLRWRDVDTNLHRFYRGIRLRVDETREALIRSLRSWRVPDDPDAYRRLIHPPLRLEDRARPTYNADQAATVGRDCMDIIHEVEAMADLVSAWSIIPPLSIGLFGEGGSGKSFFMQKMKDRVNQLARFARDSKKPQKECAYYKNIVQVEFNAWHYIEGNLWASLVENIFQNLLLEQDPAAPAGADSEDAITQRRETFLQGARDKSVEADAIEAS